jgi:tetratricopeptide (TPR) repeat protein
MAYRNFTSIAYYRRQHDEAVDWGRRAVELNPNDATGWQVLGNSLTWAGKPEEAITALETSLRIDPLFSKASYAYLGRAYLLLNRHHEAIAALQTCANLRPNFRRCYEGLAVAYVEVGQQDLARAAVAELARVAPDISMGNAAEGLPFKNHRDLDRFLAGLRKAGLE